MVILDVLGLYAQIIIVLLGLYALVTIIWDC